jgi:hypothetical protein
MKLVSFERYKNIQLLLNKISAEPNENFILDLQWNSINSKELLKLSSDGIEISKGELEAIISQDGSFNYKGQKVVVYIKDQFTRSLNFKSTAYKYHICDCATLKKMRESGRSDRYVISTRQDGIFVVNFRNYSSFLKKDVEVPLMVCFNCLKKMGRTHFEFRQKLFNKNSFELSLFLESFDTSITHLPKYTDMTAPLNEYALDQTQINVRTKKDKNYICQECKTDMSNNPKSLHVHHIDGNKNNNYYTNLKVLCFSCHKNQPYHGHLRRP